MHVLMPSMKKIYLISAKWQWHLHGDIKHCHFHTKQPLKNNKIKSIFIQKNVLKRFEDQTRFTNEILRKGQGYKKHRGKATPKLKGLELYFVLSERDNLIIHSMCWTTLSYFKFRMQPYFNALNIQVRWNENTCVVSFRALCKKNNLQVGLEQNETDDENRCVRQRGLIQNRSSSLCIFSELLCRFRSFN